VELNLLPRLIVNGAILPESGIFRNFYLSRRVMGRLWGFSRRFMQMNADTPIKISVYLRVSAARNLDHSNKPFYLRQTIVECHP